jgi:hypothetical protein
MHIDPKLYTKCPPQASATKINCYTITLEPIIKHLATKHINMNENSCNIGFVNGWIENHISIRFVNGWICLIVIP